MQKSDWKKCKLGDVVDIIMGTSPKGCDINEIGKGMPFFQGSAEFSYRYPIVKKYTTKPVRQAKRGDILFSVRAPIADINIAPKDCAIGRGVAAIRSKAPDLQRYIEFVLKGTRNEWEYLNSSGSVFGCAKKEDLLNFEIPWNDEIDVLLTISQILGSLDDKIELLQKQNKTLEDMAKALFKSWFVDFDVVRAKQKGLPKADIMREYHLTEELYDLFPSSFADSPLGPIPSGWEVKPLSKIATFLNGLALQKYPARAEEDFLPVIKIAELRNGISTSTDKANTNLPTEYIVHNGDILFSWSGSLMVKVWSGEKGALNQHLFKVFSNGYPKWFYYLWVNHYLPMFQEIAADKATTMGHIQRKHLDQAKVVCPSAAFLDKMDKIFGVILSKIILNNKQIQTLTELRNTLLPRLISGKIRV